MGIIKTHETTLYGGNERYKIALRSLSDEHLPYLYKWNSDPEVLYWTEGEDVESYPPEVVHQIYGGISQDNPCFVIEVNDEKIGTCWLQKMNLPEVKKMYAPDTDVRRIDMSIGEKSYWGKGIGTLFIGMLVKYAFECEHTDVLHCFCEDYNIRSRRVWEKNGFRLVLTEEIPQPHKGKLQYHWRLTKDEYRERSKPNFKAIIAEMSKQHLAVNHACAVVAAARSGMKNGVTIRFMEVEGIDKEAFLLMPRKRLFGSSGHRSDTPDKWFRYSYNKLRLCNIKVLLSTDIAEIGAASERIALACFYENGSVTELVPEWSYDQHSGKWSVLYSERECRDIPLAKTRYPDNTAALRDILCRMAGIADELRFDECCSECRAAIFELDKKTVRHEYGSDPEAGRGVSAPLIRYPVLPQQNAAIYNTACRSPSMVGGLYKKMLAAAEERGRAEELAALAKELTEQQRLAMLYAVNES